MMKGYEMMLITTTNILEGFRIKEYKGIVRGIIVRSPTISESFFAGLKSVVGGKMGALTNMCEKARHQAFEEMVSEEPGMAGTQTRILLNKKRRRERWQAESDHEGRKSERPA
jgi:hypothetical protein